jgi:hypothetical protein
MPTPQKNLFQDDNSLTKTGKQIFDDFSYQISQMVADYQREGFICDTLFIVLDDAVKDAKRSALDFEKTKDNEP